MASQVKSKQRVADHGEVFTNEREVKAMLDMVKQETERIESRFLEPACGDGNFLAEVLRRKLAVVKARYGKSVRDYEKYCFIAVGSIYGVELLADNAADCRNRLYSIFEVEYMKVCKKKPDERFLQAIRYVIDHNILCGDALTLLQSNGEPIIFPEWSMAMGTKVKRRDFRLDEMMEGNVEHGQMMSLFGASGNATTEWEFDEETQSYIPLPIEEYPLVSLYEVMGND